jgi:hypothetical protein
MAVKYECPKCGRRFIDWGAEKLGFKCPGCSGVGANDIIKLIRIGSGEDADLPSASLRRRAKKEVIVAPVEVDLDALVDDEAEEDEELVEEEVEEVEAVVIGEDHVVVEDEVVDEDADEDSNDEEVPVDLDFGTEKVEFDEGPTPEFDD